MPKMTARVGLASSSGALAAPASLDVRRWRVPALILGAVLACIAALALATLPSANAPGTHSPTPRRGLQSHLATSLPVSLAPAASASIGASERSFWPVRRGASLLTRGAGIHGTFTAAGADLRVAGGMLGLSVARVGRGERLAALTAAAPVGAANQVLYRRGSVTEFYRNGPYGLEQGFTVLKPQAGSGSLVLALGFSGSLLPEQVGSQIVFRTKSGVTALRYGQLSAVDAAGRRLSAHMQVRKGTIELLIDARGARYPLRIDPFIQQGEKLTGGGESSSGEFGYSVALSGDGNTALIGAPDEENVGAAWVFTRSGETWTQQQELTGGAGTYGFGHSVAISDDGNTALISAWTSDQITDAAWLFTRSGSTWTRDEEHTSTKAAGSSVALSGDGSTAMVADPGYLDGYMSAFTVSGSTWEQQGEPFRSAEYAGYGDFGESIALSKDGNTALIYQLNRAFVFTRSGEKWTQQGKALVTGNYTAVGSVALSGDGKTALIGQISGGYPGDVWVFILSNGEWVQQGEELTSSGHEPEAFGWSVALSEEGNTALIGEGGKDRAWLYTRSGEEWTQQGGPLEGPGDSYFGASVSLSSDASTALVGGYIDDENEGAAWVYANGTPRPPSVVTGAASSVTANSSTLNATVNPNGTEVSDCHFEYGTTTLYGSSAPCTTPPGSGNSAVAVAAPGSLASNTIYHFRIVATNLGGTSYGSDATLTTPLSQQEEAAITKKHEEEAATTKKHEEEAAAKRKGEEEKAATGIVSLDGSTITVQRYHEALIKLTCTGTATCSGKLTLTAKAPGRKRKTKNIGTVAFSISAGRSETVKLTLNGTGRALLSAAHGHLSSTLTILKASPSPSKTQTQGVNLVKAKSKK